MSWKIAEAMKQGMRDTFEASKVVDMSPILAYDLYTLAQELKGLFIPLLRDTAIRDILTRFMTLYLAS